MREKRIQTHPLDALGGCKRSGRAARHPRTLAFARSTASGWLSDSLTRSSLTCSSSRSARVPGFHAAKDPSDRTQDSVIRGKHFVLAGGFRPPQDSHLEGIQVRIA
jgi:hypothetical protein